MSAVPTFRLWSPVVFVVLAGLVAGVLSFAQPSAAAQGPGDVPESIEEYPCLFEVLGDREVRCGQIEVPLDREDPDSMKVTVPFAVYETSATVPKPDPVVYIDGGPGGSTIGTIGSDAPFIFQDVIADRDLVIFDQRGTGYSEPSIRCPESFVAFTDEDTVAAMADCGARLAAEGIDVSKFATDDVVLDLEALRLSLGYEPWNLYGISYGTTVALASARDVPDSVRTIVLDSTYPQGLNTDGLVPSAANAFSVLAEGCDSQPGCRNNHADVADGFVDLIAQLNETPAMVPVYDARNQEFLVPVTGTELATFVFQLMYSADALSWLPRLIGETASGDYTMLSNAAEALDEPDTSPDPDEVDPAAFVQERYLATECNERYSFLTRLEMEETNSLHPDIWPGFYSSIDDDRTFSICEVFGSGEAPAGENDQIFSDIPALVLAGAYDPITPPSWGEYAASGLSNSTFHELPWSTHGVAIASFCGAGIMAEFLNDPAGAGFGGGCESDQTRVRFQNSRAAGRAKVRNVTVENNGYIIRTRAPRNWDDSGDGVRIRDNGPLDSGTGLITTALDASNRKNALQEVRQGFADRGTKFVNRGERITTAGQWELFAGQDDGRAIDFALIEIDGAWFAQALVSELDERKRLRRVVLNQSLKRFKVQLDAETDPSTRVLATSFVLPDGSSNFEELWIEVQKASGPVVDVQIGRR